MIDTITVKKPTIPGEDITPIMPASIKDRTIKAENKSLWILTIKNLATLTEGLEVTRTLTEERGRAAEVLTGVDTEKLMDQGTITDA